MTKRKSIILIAIITILAVAVVGVSFAAIWATKPIEYSYTVGTETYSTVVIDKVGVASAKLAPSQSSAVATEAKTDVEITVVGFDNNLTFSFLDIQYEETAGNWVAVPDGVLSIEVRNVKGGEALTGAIRQDVGKVTYEISAKLIQPIEIIDPIYKNKNFRYKVNVDCVRVAKP